MNALKLLAAAALTSFAAASADAQVLRPRAVVDGDMIRLGDLFSALSPQAAERAVAPAPAPGRTAVFDAAALVGIARENRLAWEPQNRFDRAVVQRASRTITADEIEAGVLASLKAEGLDDGMRIDLMNRRMTLNAATGNGAPFEVQKVQFDRRDGSFVAVLAVRDGGDAPMPIEVRGSVYRATRVPVLARPMRQGQVIGEDDIAWKDMREGAVDPAAALDAEGIVGKTPRNALRAGEPLRRSDLVAPVIVAKGEAVTMVLATKSMTLTVKGRAIENGAEGQTIKVQNTRSHVTVEGVVAGQGRVLVSTPSLAMR